MLKRKPLKLKILVKPLAISLSLLLSCAALANHDLRPDSHQHNPLRQIFGELELSTEQRQDIKQLMRQSRADHSLNAGDLQTVKTDVTRLIHSADWNEAALKAALLQNQQTLASLGQHKASTMHKIWLLLSDEQKIKFSQLGDDKRTPHADRGFRKSEHNSLEFARRGADKLFGELDLSDAQLAAIKSIRQQNKTQSLQAKQALQGFREAERALIASNNFSEDSYQALQAEYQDAHLQHALTNAKIRHEIWNVLNAEQQAQAQEKMSERKART